MRNRSSCVNVGNCADDYIDVLMTMLETVLITLLVSWRVGVPVNWRVDVDDSLCRCVDVLTHWWTDVFNTLGLTCSVDVLVTLCCVDVMTALMCWHVDSISKFRCGKKHHFVQHSSFAADKTLFLKLNCAAKQNPQHLSIFKLLAVRGKSILCNSISKTKRYVFFSFLKNELKLNQRKVRTRTCPNKSGVTSEFQVPKLGPQRALPIYLDTYSSMGFIFSQGQRYLFTSRVRGIEGARSVGGEKWVYCCFQKHFLAQKHFFLLIWLFWTWRGECRVFCQIFIVFGLEDGVKGTLNLPSDTQWRLERHNRPSPCLHADMGEQSCKIGTDLVKEGKCQCYNNKTSYSHFRIKNLTIPLRNFFSPKHEHQKPLLTNFRQVLFPGIDFEIFQKDFQIFLFFLAKKIISQNF